MTWNPNATVTIGGDDFTGETLAGLAIHYGRPSIWEQARAGYCTVSILNLTDTDYAFQINENVVITIQDSDGTPITVFTGKVTEISNEVAASGSSATVAVQTITAVAAFAQMSRVIVGTTNYPKEYDDDRINRILTEAGVTIDVVDTPGVYQLVERQADPIDAYTLATYYAGMCFGYLYETADGKVGYANESRRTVDVNATGYLDIDEGYINWRGINSRKSISDIVNRVVLFYKNNDQVTSDDTSSITNYGLIEARIDTELHNLDEAQNIADRYVSLRSNPQTNFSSFSINLDNPNIVAADLDDLISIEMGTAIQIDNLPNPISAITYTGFVEGWDLIINQTQALLTITSSDSTYSVVPIRWQDVDPTTIWTDIDPAIATSTKTNLVPNPTFEPIDYGALGYFPVLNSSANTITTADYAALGITGDIDIRLKIAMNDWTPGATRFFAGQESGTANRSWNFGISSTGLLIFYWYALGTSASLLTINATAATGITDGAESWIRVAFDVNNGAGGRTAQFYKSSDGLNWTQIGTNVTAAGTTTLFDSTANLQFGFVSNSGLGFDGKFYAAEIRNGINGSVAFYTDVAGDFKSTDGFSYTSYSGQTMRCASTTATGITTANSNYGWNANTGSVISGTTDTGYSGRGSMKCDITIAGTARGPFIPSGFRPAVTAGQTYTASAYVKDFNTGSTWRGLLQWYSAVTGGTLIGQTTGTATAISNTGWTRITVTGTAPVGANAVTIFYQNATSAAIGTYCYFDAFQFEAGSTASTYFDGYASDIPNKEYPVLAWTGTPQQSTSTAVAYWGTKPTTLWQNVDTVGLP
jgi:hypothetical protein